MHKILVSLILVCAYMHKQSSSPFAFISPQIRRFPPHPFICKNVLSCLCSHTCIYLHTHFTVVFWIPNLKFHHPSSCARTSVDLDSTYVVPRCMCQQWSKKILDVLQNVVSPCMIKHSMHKVSCSI